MKDCERQSTELNHKLNLEFTNPRKNDMERKRLAFSRYAISGIVFTITAPILFWNFYFLGAVRSVVTTELIIHLVRFNAFKYYVYPKTKGYRSSVRKYLLSIAPTTVSALIMANILENIASKEITTVLISTVSMTVGFGWSRYVYKNVCVACDNSDQVERRG